MNILRIAFGGIIESILGSTLALGFALEMSKVSHAADLPESSQVLPSQSSLPISASDPSTRPNTTQTPPPSKFQPITMNSVAMPMTSASVDLASGLTFETALTLRDPFRKPVQEVKTQDTRTELEQFPVDAFKLVGVTTGPHRIRALLLGPNGKTYIVSERMRIGSKGGVIRRIFPDSVQVREKVINILGQEENLDLVIAMNVSK